MIYWEVTSKCNNSCFYCLNQEYRKSLSDLSRDKILQIPHILKGFGIDKVCVTGGEPLLRDDIIEIIESLHAAKINNINIVTNATILNPSLFNKISSYLKKISVTFHLDWNLTAPYYNGDYFTRLIDSIEKITKHNVVPVEANFILMKRNLNYLPEVIEKVISSSLFSSVQIQNIILRNGTNAYLNEVVSDTDVSIFFDNLHKRIKKYDNGAPIQYNDFNKENTRYYVIRPNGAILKHTETRSVELGNILDSSSIDVATFSHDPHVNKQVFMMENRRDAFLDKIPDAYIYDSGLLSDKDIEWSIKKGEIFIQNISQPQTQYVPKGCSLDLKLSNEYYRWRPTKRFMRKKIIHLASADNKIIEELFEHHEAEKGKGILLSPGEYILTRTEEYVRLSPAIAALITGRSTYSRLGIGISLTQNMLAPGHENTVPLQIRNNTPYSIIIYPGTSICQLLFMKLSSPAKSPYNSDNRSKYIGDKTRLLPKIGSGELLVEIETERSYLNIDWKSLHDSALINITLLTILLYVSQLSIKPLEMQQAIRDFFLYPMALLSGGLLILKIILFINDFIRKK